MSASTNINPKILIAGAGPSGLVLALALRRHGIPVKIIDKAPVAPGGQRGSGIQPRTQEVFRTLGVLDDIVKQALLLPPMRTYVAPEGIVPLKTFHMTAPLDPTPASPLVNIITIGQNHLESTLRTALKTYSCEVEFGTPLVSFTQDAHGVDVVIGKGDNDAQDTGSTVTERFDFLVGADGARGAVRKQLGLSFLGESRPSVRFIIADVHHWHMWGDTKTNSVLLRPTEVPGLFGLAMTVAGSNINFETVMKDRAVLQSTISTITGRIDLDLTEVVWITQWTPNIRMTETFSVGRCFLTGDAAHVHSPTGGQGLNSGVQDSFNLAWKLALVVQNHAPLALLDSYNQERLPVIAEMLGKTTDLLDRTVGASSIAGDISHWDRGGPLLMLGINYRWSSFVVDEQDGVKMPNDPYGVHICGLRAGDRAPDAPDLKGIHNQTSVRLFDIFGFSHHTILVLSDVPERRNLLLDQLLRYPQGSVRCAVILVSGAAACEASIQGPDSENMILEDTKGHAYATYHFEGKCDIVIVRPDGVIGAVVRSTEGVQRYFAQIFA
ncbi:FAD binding domain-containing protein [Mycena haematopus]|nr:FAD binding domain-containing protein [Mycena haematopus]